MNDNGCPTCGSKNFKELNSVNVEIKLITMKCNKCKKFWMC